MSKQPNQDRSNRAKARRRQREASRVPGKGAGNPIPIRTPEGQPAVTSLAELAKAGGQVPLNIPQLMVKVGALNIERDFWMNAAVTLEAQVNALTGGAAVPSLADIAAADEEEGEEELVDTDGNPVQVCPGCTVTLLPDAVHAEDCEFEGHISTAGEFAPEEEEKEAPTPIGANVPPESLPTELTDDEKVVVAEANRIMALQQESEEDEEESLVSAEEVETVRQATED